jgi:demethylmenaquinone methyltransferase/2-methoxy-6-polyprenyl-1,4-benzoquinol methylase
MVDRVVERQPTRIADVASGTCRVASDLAARSEGWVAALDLTEAMLRRGRTNVFERQQQARIGFVVGRAEGLPFRDASFDALTFTYLLRYVEDPYLTLRELARVVVPGGIVASLEFGVPRAPLWRAGWWLYTRGVLPLAGWLLGGREWFRVGRFLGPSIASHSRAYSLEWTTSAWNRAGFTSVEARPMSLGAGLVMWGIKSDG